MPKPNQIDIVTERVATAFPTFGGGKTSNWNPIANALVDKPPQFAAGVHVRTVVEFVVKETKSPTPAKLKRELAKMAKCLQLVWVKSAGHRKLTFRETNRVRAAMLMAQKLAK